MLLLQCSGLAQVSLSHCHHTPYQPPPNSVKKSQQFGRTIWRAYFSAKCFPVTRIMALVTRSMALAPQTHCPFGCSVVRDMWKPLLAEKKFASC